MSQIAWRIAVVGAGPAGIYAAHEILRQSTTATVDLIDRLPTLGGLARSGVAPDHHVRREVIGWYERLALASGRFRFHGDVEVGVDVSTVDLSRVFDAVIYSHGCQIDRRLGLSGEDLPGSHSATEFVGWYNGHPDYRDRAFDLACDRAVVIGNGNVALDVARLLLMDRGLLSTTDIADHALDALAANKVREVVIVGRRDVEHCAFTTPEVMELGDLAIDVAIENAHFPTAPDDAAGAKAFATTLKCRLLQEYAARPRRGDPRMVLRFLTSPVAIVGTESVTGVRLVTNRLRDLDGRVVAEPTAEIEELPAGLVIRSVGSEGKRLSGLPFDTAAGIVPNVNGRVVAEPQSGDAGAAYVAGWIKRGPSGVIGSNKLCARETVATMFADLAAGRGNRRTSGVSLVGTVLQNGKIPIDYAGWKRIDQAEIGAATGSHRPRVKITDWASLRTLAQPGQ